MKINSAIWSGLRVFHYCTQSMSFTAAANSLNVTTGAVSQQIKQLEQQLGYRLFYRTTRKLSLTHEGSLLAEVIEHAYRQIENQLNSISSSRHRGAVRLIASPSFTLQWLVPRLGDFYRRYPDIDLVIDAQDQIERLDPASYDLAVDYLLHEQSHSASELFMNEELVPVCKPKLLQSTEDQDIGPFDTLTQLFQHPILHDSNPWPTGQSDQEWLHWISHVDVKTITDCQQIFFNRSDLAVEAAQEGQGIALGRWALIHSRIKQGKLAIAFDHRVLSPAGYYFYFAESGSEHGKSAGHSNANVLYQWLKSTAAESLVGE